MYSSILFSTIIKGILVYILALVLSKLIGIKIISQMNFFDFVMGVSIGSMIAKIIISIKVIRIDVFLSNFSFMIYLILPCY